MKKIILLAAITIFSVATSNAQTAKKAAKKADAPVNKNELFFRPSVFVQALSLQM